MQFRLNVDYNGQIIQLRTVSIPTRGYQEETHRLTHVYGN